MAVTALDPQTALIVIDLQNGIRDDPTLHPIDAAVKLARLFGRLHGGNASGAA